MSNDHDVSKAGALGLALSAYALIAGCYIEFHHGIEVDENIVKVHDQDRAMLLGLADVESHYELRVPDHEAVVFWTSTRCPYHMAEYAVVHQGVCSYGVLWSCEEIFVALSNRDPERTCKSALLHEYGHCLRMTLGWDSDGCNPDGTGHVDDEFWLVNANTAQQACLRQW